jgi:hypothetical protein
LYPTNDKYINKKKSGFNLKKGAVSIQENLMSGDIKISIPYWNHLKEKCYTAVINHRLSEQQSHLKIVMHRTGKADLKCDFSPFPFMNHAVEEAP